MHPASWLCRISSSTVIAMSLSFLRRDQRDPLSPQPDWLRFLDHVRIAFYRVVSCHRKLQSSLAVRGRC